MPLLQLSLLGNPQLLLNGALQPISRRKALALLAYLAVTGVRQSRDQLSEMLYPQQPRNHARGGLRLALYSLKAILGNTFVGADSTWIWMNITNEVYVDVRTFRFCAESAIKCGDCDSTNTRMLLEEAANLYTGEFLNGFYLDDCFTFEEWQESCTRTYHGLYLEVLDRLVSHLDKEGDLSTAQRYAYKLYHMDRSNEIHFCQLLDLLRRTGKREEAAEIYQSHEKFLKRELSCAPSSEIEALFEAIIHTPTLKAPVYTDTLPCSLDAFIGRIDQLALLKSLLEEDSPRVITITGTAGVGKTRLVVEAAKKMTAQFTDGIAFVDLCTIENGVTFYSVVAEALRMPITHGDNNTLCETIASELQRTDVLLILDNMEHLLPEVTQYVEQLFHMAHKTVVITSREALRLRFETVIDLEPLRTLGQYPAKEGISEAATLFCDRATNAYPEFSCDNESLAIIEQICSTIDGLPLAIELAAAWIRMITPSDLVDRLNPQIDLLQGGYRDALGRQYSMQNALEWSFALLTPNEQMLFRRLSFFRGSFTTSGAEAVARPTLGINAAPILSSLIEKHLISKTTDGHRFSMIKVIEEFANLKLDSIDERHLATDAFILHIVTFLEDIEQKFTTSEHPAAHNAIEDEYANIRAALEICKREVRAEEGLQIVAVLGDFWEYRGRFREGVRWLIEFCERDYCQAYSGTLAKAYCKLALIQRMSGPVNFTFFEEDKTATEFAKRALHFAVDSHLHQYEALALTYLGLFSASKSWEKRYAFYNQGENSARASGNNAILCDCIMRAYSAQPRVDQTIAAQIRKMNECIDLAKALGDPYRLGMAYHGKGDVFMKRNEHDSSVLWHEKALRFAVQSACVTLELGTLSHLAPNYYARGAKEKAQRCAERCQTLAMRSGSITFTGGVLSNISRVEILHGHILRGIRLGGAASNIIELDLKGRSPRLFDVAGAEDAWNEGKSMTTDEAIAYALEGMTDS